MMLLFNLESGNERRISMESKTRQQFALEPSSARRLATWGIYLASVNFVVSLGVLVLALVK